MVQVKRDDETALPALKELFRRRGRLRTEAIKLALGDREGTTGLATTAVVELGSEALPENQQLLVSLLDTKQPALFLKTVQALAKIGDAKALEALERTQPSEAPAARRALDFAKSLLAYRLRLGQHLLPVPPETQVVPATKGIPFRARKAKAELIREAFAEAKPEVPAIPLAEEGAALLTCRNVELLLAFTAEFREVQALMSLRERSGVLFVLLQRSGSLHRWALAGYFFAQPSKGGQQVTLLGTRPGGEVTYLGKMRAGTERVDFTLQAVESRYAPALEVEAHYDLKRRTLKFDKAITSTQVSAREKKAPTPRKAAAPAL